MERLDPISVLPTMEASIPACIRLQMDRILPHLSELLSDMLDPNAIQFKTLTLLPNLACPKILNPEPIRHRVLILMEDPNRIWFSVDIDDPSFPELLREKLLPSCIKSKTLTQGEDPTTISEKIEHEDPILVNSRVDRAEPKCAKSRIDTEPPKRARELSEKLLPILHAILKDKDEPIAR
jgi:hypothetical protein